MIHSAFVLPDQKVDPEDVILMFPKRASFEHEFISSICDNIKNKQKMEPILM